MNFNGIFTLELQGEKIYLELPNLINTGIIYSKQKVYVKDIMMVVDPSSGLRSVISFGRGDTLDQINGFITEIPEEMDVNNLIKTNFEQPIKKRKNLIDFCLNDLKPKMKKINLQNFRKLIKKNKVKNLSIVSEISGSWTDNIIMDKTSMWNNKFKGHSFHLIKDPIPSDFRFREDLLWLRHGNVVNAQKWKIRLEAVFRDERKRRNKLKN